MKWSSKILCFSNKSNKKSYDLEKLIFGNFHLFLFMRFLFSNDWIVENITSYKKVSTKFLCDVRISIYRGKIIYTSYTKMMAIWGCQSWKPALTLISSKHKTTSLGNISVDYFDLFKLVNRGWYFRCCSFFNFFNLHHWCYLFLR